MGRDRRKGLRKG
jgi:hypothetical protein